MKKRIGLLVRAGTVRTVPGSIIATALLLSGGFGRAQERQGPDALLSQVREQARAAVDLAGEVSDAIQGLKGSAAWRTVAEEKADFSAAARELATALTSNPDREDVIMREAEALLAKHESRLEEKIRSIKGFGRLSELAAEVARRRESLSKARGRLKRMRDLVRNGLSGRSNIDALRSTQEKLRFKIETLEKRIKTQTDPEVVKHNREILQQGRAVFDKNESGLSRLEAKRSRAVGLARQLTGKEEDQAAVAALDRQLEEVRKISARAQIELDEAEARASVPQPATVFPRMSHYSGDVVVRRGGEEVAVGATETAFRAGDVIRTGADGTAELQCSDGSRIYLDAENQFTCQTAARILGNLGNAATPAQPKLRELLAAADPKTRLYAAYALYGAGGTAAEVLPVYTAALKKRDPDNRFLASQCLGAMGSTGTPALVDLRSIAEDEKEDEKLRQAARDAVRSITGV